MPPAKINYRALQLAIDRPVERACRQIAILLAEEKFEDAKAEFLQDFLDHPVSQEIQEGPTSGGDILSTEGNLFGFLGFQEGSDPIGDLYEFLEQRIRITKTPIYDRVRKRYIFNVRAPTKESIKIATPMEWGTARSWAFSIETGIPGLNHYLFSKKRDLGRSTAGIQAKNVVNSGGYQAQKYLTDLLKNFANNLRR